MYGRGCWPGVGDGTGGKPRATGGNMASFNGTRAGIATDAAAPWGSLKEKKWISSIITLSSSGSLAANSSSAYKGPCPVGGAIHVALVAAAAAAGVRGTIKRSVAAKNAIIVIAVG